MYSFQALSKASAVSSLLLKTGPLFCLANFSRILFSEPSVGMATGVEVRVPFLDKDLVEFSTKIPPRLKMKGVTTKYLLKKMMERYLPNDIIYRSKAGFGAPVRQWILHDLEPTIDNYLSQKSVKKRGIFDYTQVQQLIAENRKGEIDASYSIWSLLAIESWCRQFVEV